MLVDPRRANVVETNQSVLSNFGTDDATIESQALLIQSVAILERVVGKLKLTEDPEFKPKPGLLDPIRRLFSSSGPSDGASPEDAARARSVEILQRRMKVTRQGTTFLVDINVSSESPQKAATDRQRDRGCIFRGTGSRQIRCDADRRDLAQRPDRRAEVESRRLRKGGRGFSLRQ